MRGAYVIKLLSNLHKFLVVSYSMVLLKFRNRTNRYNLSVHPMSSSSRFFTLMGEQCCERYTNKVLRYYIDFNSRLIRQPIRKAVEVFIHP